MSENELKPEKTPEEKKKENKNAAKGCLVIFAIIALVVWIFYPKGEEAERLDAFAYAQTFVKRELKSPSTAQFSIQKDAVITKLDDGKYKVESFVDAQNSFGAMLRKSFIVIMHKNDDNWYCDYLEIDGQQYK
jgi:hypothetical protein